MAKIVVRITRHPLDNDRREFLMQVFGEDLQIVTDDIRYGDDPVGSVKELIAGIERNGDQVVAIEAQAPFPALMRLVDARRDLGVPLIRAQFERDQNGRAIVIGQDSSGRDLLKFSFYEELERIEFQTRKLGR